MFSYLKNMNDIFENVILMSKANGEFCLGTNQELKKKYLIKCKNMESHSSFWNNLSKDAWDWF